MIDELDFEDFPDPEDIADDADLATVGRSLLAWVKVLAGRVKRLADKERNRRRLTIGFLVSVLLDIALSVVLFLVVDHNADQDRHREADQRQLEIVVDQLAVANNALRVSCLSTNEQSNSQHELWEGTIAASPVDPNETPEERAAREAGITDFLARLDQAFPQRDCDNLDGG